MLPPLDIPALLGKYGLRPDKRLGQNFLVDDAALIRVVRAAKISEEDAVLEVGAGLGSLTRYLVERSSRVVAVELDQNLIPALREVLSGYDNIQIVHGDILNLRPDTLVSNPNYLVVANIPYYITSALLRHLLEARIRPRRMVLTLQQEVAKRICAQPGDMSLLSLSVQVYGEPRIVGHIDSKSFYPIPQVDSAIIRVALFKSPLIGPSQVDLFFRLAKAGFSQKRKTLRNSLSAGMLWPKEKTERLLRSAGINPMRRAQSLSIDQWRELTLRSSGE